MDLALTASALRQFDPNHRGPTTIPNIEPDTFLKMVESVRSGWVKAPGYTPYCRHIFVPNFTGARIGVVKIDDDNRHLLRSGYVARSESELPVLDRWFPRDAVPVVHAPWLDLIVYAADQLQAEAEARGEAWTLPYGVTWAIVCIKSEIAPVETPMDPATITRNALGKEFGGSGNPIGREEYAASVEYWSEWARIGE